MKRTLLTILGLGVSGLAAGPLAGALLAGVRAADGGLDATALTAASPAMGLAATLGAIAIATVCGVLVALTVGGGRALFAMGLVLLWPAVQSGAVEGLLRSFQSGRVLRRLALEGAIIGAAALAGAVLVGRVALWTHTRTERADAYRKAPNPRRAAIDLIVAVAASAVAFVFVAWIFAVDGLKGQAVASAIVAGVAGGLMARLAGGEAPRWTIVLAAVAVSVWAPLWALRLPAGMSALQAAYAGVLFPPARLVPLDWLAGALLGGPVGWSWAASALRREERDAIPAPSAA